MEKMVEDYRYRNSVWAAPLAGITDKAYRQVIREVCAGMFAPVHMITEMISCHALHYNNRRTLAMLDLSGEPEPRTVQIFGADPALMAEAAQRLIDLGATGININMGCPVPKIVGNDEGAALLKDVPLAAKIARAVVAGVNGAVPVSVKTRLGWDGDHIVIFDLARRLEQAGTAALMVHARTRTQYYTGDADWGWLTRVKQATAIPVIGNGDIRGPEDAVRMMELTGCDGVMIGRAVLGNPWVMARTARAIGSWGKTSGRPVEEEWQALSDVPAEGLPEVLPDVPPEEKLRVIRRHMELLIGYKGEDTAVREMRKHALWYIKGVRGAARLRERIARVQSEREFAELMAEVFGCEG